MKLPTCVDAPDQEKESADRSKMAVSQLESRQILVSDLGWTREQAAQIRASLQAFDEDWNYPGMEEYDRL
jgi:hypothetical protein